MSESRRYGYFSCDNCDNTWESSHVYCDKGTFDALYEQECSKCDTPCFPDLVEKLRCSQCEMQECICTEEELDEKKRNIDPNKPHRSDLCHRCRSGQHCTGNVF